jgi:Zn-dependent protease/CBS domain-containing protein
MFGRRISLFKLFGFSVNIDITWFILAILFTWTFAEGVFPSQYKGLSSKTYWWMGITAALGLFASIVFHEFCHSLVARRYGLPMKGITLFVFGGVAEMEQEPDSPKIEFLMAIAGPISSVLLATFLLVIYMAGRRVGCPKPACGVLWYLGFLNYLLAGFNMLPAFPLDGGRVLRSILWAIKGNLRWATRIASNLGSAFGLFLIVTGLLRFFSARDFVGGVWSALIGMFIRNASQMSYKQLLMRRALGGEEVRRFMKTNPITVPSSASIEQLVNDYFYRYHFKMFPVSDGDRLTGCVTSGQVKDIPRDQWAGQTVGDLAKPCSAQNTIGPETDAMKALSMMNLTGNSRLMVVDQGRLVGVITLKDMLKFLDLKIDLEPDRT